MAVVVVEPDAVHGVVDQQGAESLHAVGAVAGVGGAKALPAVRRRADLSVRTDGRGVRVLLEVAGLVHGVEFGEDAGALAPELLDAFPREAAGADPDGVD